MARSWLGPGFAVARPPGPAGDPVPVRAVLATAEHCVKCNVCTTVCPVSAVTERFPGPKYEGPQAQRFRQRGGPAAGDRSSPDPFADRGRSPDASVDLCSGCGLCTQACPAGVLVAEINAVARGRMVASAGGLGWRDQLLGRPDLMGSLGAPVAPALNALLASPPARAILERVAGVDRRAALPRFSVVGFRAWARRRPAFDGARRTVAYFHGCSTGRFEAEVGAAVVRVLERSGIGVSLPPQGCCGLPLLSAGDFPGARRSARRVVSRLAGAAADPGVIVASSTSCGLALKAKHRELLGLDDPAAERVSHAVWDVCELLAELAGEGTLDRAFAPLEARALYHPQCQLAAHGIGTPALELLRLVPGLSVESSAGGCCGMAGSYGTKVGRYAIAAAVGRDLAELARAGGFDFAVCDSEACRWHIAKLTGLPVYHPVQVLDHAYRALA